MAESIELNGEVYKKINGQWVDGTYCVPPHTILTEIYKNLVDLSDLTKYSDDYLEKHLVELKANGLFSNCLAIIRYLLPKFENNKNVARLRFLLPVYTSCLRSIGNPQAAIREFDRLNNLFGKAIVGSMLATSIAAAYCDVEDFEKARKYCDMAYAMQGGKQEGYNELTFVYKRIEKHLQKP